MTDMIEIKTSDLKGVALDWAVAKIERIEVTIRPTVYPPDSPMKAAKYLAIGDMGLTFNPSTDWRQGGPLIEKHQIELKWEGIDGKAYWWSATHQDVVQFQLGDKPLIAACRAIVAATLGDTVRVPKELMP